MNVVEYLEANFGSIAGPKRAVSQVVGPAPLRGDMSWAG